MWTIKPRHTPVSTSSGRKATLLLTGLLLGLLFFTVINRPFSLLYKYVHSEKTLSKVAEELNQHRTQAAKEYFVRTRDAGSRQVAHVGKTKLRDGQTAEGNRNDQQQKHGSPRGRAMLSQAGVTIAIVSVKRQASAQSIGYVIQSAAALDSLLGQQESDNLFADSVLFVCNVDDHPELHSDAGFLKDYVAFVERYGVSSSEFGVNFSMTIPGTKGKFYREVRHESVYDKERVDYMFCLQAAWHFRSQYVLIVEDDALALPEMPSVVQHALHRLTDTLVTPVRSWTDERESDSLLSSKPCPSGLGTRGSNGNEPEVFDSAFSGQSGSSSGFVYLKLFFPLYWQGFAYELIRILDLVCMTVILAFVVIVLLQMTVHRRRLPSNRTIGVVIVFSLASCVLLGRQNVNEIRRLSRYFFRLQSSPECCTPAVLYPCDVAPALLTSLSRCRSNRHVDMCIADFVKRSGLPAYSLEPNLFSHVGMVTSLNMGNKHPEELLFHSKFTQF